MDWTKQAEEMLKTWTGAQKSMWDSWVNTVQGLGTNQSGETWEKSIETWQDSIKRALEAQNTWTQFWIDSITSSTGSNAQATDWAKQVNDMSKRWNDTQTQLWDNWFETMKKADPSAVSKNFNMEELQKIVQTWQEASQKAVESQMEWTRMLIQQGDKK